MPLLYRDEEAAFFVALIDIRRKETRQKIIAGSQCIHLSPIISQLSRTISKDQLTCLFVSLSSSLEYKKVTLRIARDLKLC